MSTEIFGWVAAALSLIYKLPQMYRLWRAKKIDGLSVTSLMVQTISYGFYIAHGVTINDLPILWMGIVALVQSLLVIGLYFYYKHQRSEQTTTHEQNARGREQPKIANTTAR